MVSVFLAFARGFSTRGLLAESDHFTRCRPPLLSPAAIDKVRQSMTAPLSHRQTGTSPFLTTESGFRGKVFSPLQTALLSSSGCFSSRNESYSLEKSLPPVVSPWFCFQNPINVRDLQRYVSRRGSFLLSSYPSTCVLLARVFPLLFSFPLTFLLR